MSEMKAAQQSSTSVVSANVRQQQRDGEMEIDLGELFLRLLDKWYIIVAAALIGTLISGIWTFYFITPMYEATTKLYILNSTNSAINLSDLQIGSQLAADYPYVFQNWYVHEKVIEELGLSYNYKEIGNMVKVNNPSGTRLLDITVTSPDPKEAQLLANTYAKVGREFISAVMKTEEPTVFQEARVPERPSSPSKTRNLIIGFLLGAIIACAFIVIDFIQDDKVRTADDITKLLGLPTLGVVTMQSGMSGDNSRKYKGAKK
jgi:capsular polysaccharide biosynthesis protein